MRADNEYINSYFLGVPNSRKINRRVLCCKTGSKDLDLNCDVG